MLTNQRSHRVRALDGHLGGGLAGTATGRSDLLPSQVDVEVDREQSGVQPARDVPDPVHHPGPAVVPVRRVFDHALDVVVAHADGVGDLGDGPVVRHDPVELIGPVPLLGPIVGMVLVGDHALSLVADRPEAGAECDRHLCLRRCRRAAA